MPKRKAISARSRFEVFKRDSFTCQYCGEAAPEVILHIDHITPVAKGGDNSILNLITSCQACNLGKSDKELSDSSEIKKQKEMLDSLNERRNQIKMMVEWRKELSKIDDIAADAVFSIINDGCEAEISVSESGRRLISSAIKLHGFEKVCDVAHDFIGRNKGPITNEQAGYLISKLKAFCAYKNMPAEKQKAAYIAGILKNRVFFSAGQYGAMINKAIDLDIDLNKIEELAKTCRHWTAFKQGLLGAIAEGEK